MAYLATFDGVFLWVNLRDPYHPKIETVMEIWTYTFRILEDYKLAIMQKYS